MKKDKDPIFPRDAEHADILKRLSLFCPCDVVEKPEKEEDEGKKEEEEEKEEEEAEGDQIKKKKRKRKFKCSRKCKGFKPEIINYDEEDDHASFTTEIYDVLKVDFDGFCRNCRHTMRHHMKPLKELTYIQHRRLHEMLLDAEMIYFRMKCTINQEELNVFFRIFRLFIDTIKKFKFNVLMPIGQPPFEVATSEIAVANFINEYEDEPRVFHAYEKLGSIILNAFNNWEPPTPKEYCKKFPRVDVKVYQKFYVRWIFYTDFPRELVTIPQYEPVDIFSYQGLRYYLKWLNPMLKSKTTPPNIPAASTEELYRFSIRLISSLDDEIKEINDKQKIPTLLNDNINLKYSTHTEKRADPHSHFNQRRKKIIPEKDSIDDMTILQTMVKMHNQELQIKEKEREAPLKSLRGLSARDEEVVGIVKFVEIGNTGSHAQMDEKLAYLIQLQTLFSIQLPKMPPEYITRLVFDTRHKSLVLVKQNIGVIGGICYRPFPHRGFIEIVFCAITANEQVKGYGTHMMNTLKDIQIRDSIFHCLTYADDFATGYFTKQGFSKKLTINKKQWSGHIKEYEGANLMGCQLHPQMKYRPFSDYIKLCSEFHSALVSAKNPNVKKKYGGLESKFRQMTAPLKYKQIPGMEKFREYDDMEKDDEMEYKIKNILKKLEKDPNAWPFVDPVDPDEVPEYHEHIKNPSYLALMHERLKSKYYVHERLFIADLQRLFVNCYSFNGTETPYYRMGYELNKVAFKLVSQQFPDSDLLPHLPDQEPTDEAEL